MKESYCLFRLYAIMRCDWKKFNLTQDRDLEMYYLIQSCAYFDYLNDERYSDYNIYLLAVHLDIEDVDTIKTR